MSNAERLLAAVSHSDVLNRAWLRFKGSRGLWAPGVPMAHIAANPVGPMLKLVEEIRSGHYRPSVPQMISVAKADGGRRELAIYAVRDRIAQRALLDALHGRTERAMSPASYGYRPGRGVADALARVQQHLDDGRTWVVDADIELCFDTIPRQRLLDQVARRLDDTNAAELVAHYLGWTERDYRSQIGIPQGAVLAPWLCNIFLWQLDDHVTDIGDALVRYADDFVVQVNSEARARRAHGDCEAFLRSLQLRLNPSKTRVVGGGERFHFLGRWLRTARPSALTLLCRRLVNVARYR